MSNLDQHIKKHYASKSLSKQHLDGLIAEGQSLRRHKWRRAIATFATAAVLIIGFTYFTHFQDQSQLNQRIIAEIAMNHNKQLDIEIITQNYADLQQQMDHIDFPIHSDTIPNDLQLVGGRYCSIQGELAAQLKLKHKKTGDVSTLYVTHLAKSLQNVHDQTITQDHITIRLWKTSDCFFGLASTSRP